MNSDITLSDASPIQLWYSDKETFNEKIVDGVFRKFFCLPVECSDTVTIQFSSTETAVEFKLFLYDSNGNLVHDFDFSNVADDVWRVSFVPNNYSPDLCDGCIRFIVVDQQVTDDYQFNSDLDGWLNDGAGNQWAWSSEYGGSAKANNQTSTRQLKLSKTLSGDTKILVDFYINGDDPSITFRCLDGASSIVFAETKSGTIGEGSYTWEVPASAAVQTATILFISGDTSGGVQGVINIKRIRIYNASGFFTLGPELLTNGDFASNLNGWTNDGDGTAWVWDAGTGSAVGVAGASIAALATDRETKILDQPVDFVRGSAYIINVDYSVTNVNIGTQIKFILTDGTNERELIIAELDGSESGEYIEQLFIIAEEEYTMFGMQVYAPYISGGGDTVILIDSISLKKVTNQFLKSDCISFKETHKETVLITYSNHRNFADLDNLNVSPDTEFYLRIPGVFFVERFPQESEVEELSNSTSVQLNAQVKAQRLLSMGPMPFYMHRKMSLVLAHQNVEIDDLEWVKQENYEITATKRTNPLSKAVVWLTEKDYIKRNIL